MASVLSSSCQSFSCSCQSIVSVICRSLYSGISEIVLLSSRNGLILAAEKQKANRLKREQEKREWEENERRGEEERRIRQQEQALIDKLEKEAMGWHRSKIILSYIEAATAAYIQKNGKVESGSEFDKWKTWAGQQADRLDPLVNKSIT